MHEIGDKALNVLKFINERFQVTNDDLISACPENPFLEVALLQEMRFIAYRTSSNDTFDYQISPMGRDYLERHASELKQMEQTSKYQQNMEAGLQESNARVDLLNTQVDNIKKQMEDADAANARAARKAQITANISIVIAFVSMVAAIVSVVITLVRGQTV